MLYNQTSEPARFLLSTGCGFARAHTPAVASSASSGASDLCDVQTGSEFMLQPLLDTAAQIECQTMLSPA